MKKFVEKKKRTKVRRVTILLIAILALVLGIYVVAALEGCSAIERFGNDPASVGAINSLIRAAKEVYKAAKQRDPPVPGR